MQATDLASFVPTLALELGITPGSHATSVEGSMLSADISGFTALSEKLAGKGKAGAEEITELINTCFTALIDSAYGYDGEIIKFGGDALLVLFRGRGHERRCANAAMAMQIALHASPAAKRANLTMTVGACDGPFHVFLAGTTYRDLLIIGPAASKVIHLEGEADKGETLVSDALAAHVPAALTGRRHAGGIALTGAPVDPPSSPRPRDKTATRIEDFVPPQVVEQLAAFSELGGEHRLVSVGFVLVGGIAASLDGMGPSGTADALGALIDEVIAVTRPYGVTALHTDIAPDGFKIVLAAGAPVNPGDISDALLQSMLAIAAVDTRYTMRMGAQTGRVFAGFLGAPYRRTYTLMGDPVNTAARMLGKAGDREIVAVASMVDDTRSVFDIETIEPFSVKGKSEPMVAYRVRGVTDTVRRDGSTTRLFGRHRELEILSRAIGELGEIVDLVGPAGVGKSRLLDAAWDEAEGLMAFHGTCTPYGSSSPYSLFRPLLRGGIGIDLRADPSAAGEQLRAFVTDRAPQMLPLLPLLAVPFGADVGSTPEVDAIDPEFRRARIHGAVVDFYDTTLGDRAVFLVVEDLHWVDDASGELVNHLVGAAATRPWAGVTTRRPEGAWEIDSGLPHVTTLRLEPLNTADIRGLVIEASSEPLADATIDLIVERAGGNPLFALELASAAVRGNTAELPDSVEQVISSRIDELHPRLRHLVRIASVFGNSFDIGDVAPVLAEESPGSRLDDPRLADVVERRGARTWAFRHALYRDAVYEGLPYRRRRELHGRIGEHLEAQTDDPASIADLLSVHFSAARRHPQAWTYSRIAGDTARASFANLEAAELYRRALASVPYVRGVASEEKARTWEALGNTLELSGQYEAAFHAYQRQKQLSDDVDTRVRATRRQARARQRLKNFTAAIRLLHAAEAMLRGVRREPWVHRRLAEIHLNLSGIRMDQGQQYEARTEGELAEYHAAKAGDDALLVQALGAIVGGLTDWEEARDYLGAVELAASIGANEAESMLAQNLGMIAFYEGEWSQAVELYERGGMASTRIGNVTIATAAEMNAAEILVDQGHLGPAREILENACRVFRAARYESALLYAQLNLGTAMIRSGDRVEGHEMLTRCAAGFREGAMQLYAHEAELRLAESHLLAHETDAARAKLSATLDTAASLDRAAVIEARARRLLAVGALLEEDRAAAATAATTAEQICRREHLRFELALALLARHEADGTSPDEALTILRGLGVVEVPFHAWASDDLGAQAVGPTSS